MARSAGNVNRILRTGSRYRSHSLWLWDEEILSKQNLNTGKSAHGCMIKCLGTTCIKGGY